MTDRSDAALISQVLNGNAEAYGALVARYRERYARFAVRYALPVVEGVRGFTG